MDLSWSNLLLVQGAGKPANRVLAAMSDDPKHRGRAEGARIATIGAEELRLFVADLRTIFPHKSATEVEAALELGLEETHCAASRHALREAVSGILARP
jgi:hypothetical protein